MNILVITREIPPVGGGAGHVALHLAQRAADAGHAVTIITMGFGELPTHETRGAIDIHRVWCARRFQDSSYYREMLLFLAQARRLIGRLARERPFDLVHAHAIFPDGLIAVGLGVPLVITAHGSDVPGYNPDKFALGHKLIKPLWHFVLDRTALLVAPSTAHADLIRRQRPRQAITVIPNGIAIDSLTPRAKSGAFLICSRLVRRKNYQLFLQALAEIAAPQSVEIVGDGPMTAELKTLAARCPQHRVRFHGWLANGSPPWTELYETSRFFVFPSEWENFPINLLEAQLAGLIVIASDIPGNREALGEHAFYLPILSVDGLVTTLRAILATPAATLDDIATKARARVREQFSWDTVGGHYLEGYRALVS